MQVFTCISQGDAGLTACRCPIPPEIVARMELLLAPLQTARLRLEPLTAETARAIVAGDLSGLTTAKGWPHDDTLDGLGMAVKGGQPPGWLITAGGAVIGDIGTHGPVDEAGSVEIGYGLAAPSRGQGYGSEAVAAVTGWLLSPPGPRAHADLQRAQPPRPGEGGLQLRRPRRRRGPLPAPMKVPRGGGRFAGTVGGRCGSKSAQECYFPCSRRIWYGYGLWRIYLGTVAVGRPAG